MVEENGPYATFFFNGSLERKGNLGKGGVVGDYLEYHDNGKIFKKGEYNNNGQRIGTWVDGLENGFYTVTDYNHKIPQMSGFTKENKLRFVSSAVGGDRYSEPYGNIILFYPSGSVEKNYQSLNRMPPHPSLQKGCGTPPPGRKDTLPLDWEAYPCPPDR